MEGKNEKDIKFLAICFIIIQSIVIGFVAFFVVGIARVDAAEYIDINPLQITTQFVNDNGITTQVKQCSYNNLGNCNLDLDTNTGQRFSIKLDQSYYASASNTLTINFVIGFKYVTFSNPDIIVSPNSTIVRYLDSNNNVVKDVSGSCQTRLSKVGGNNSSNLQYFTGSVICGEMNPGGNATQLQVYLSAPPTGEPLSLYNQYARIASYAMQRFTGTQDEIDKMIQNSNRNTNWIIQNIDSNTSSIVQGQWQNTQDIINNQNDNTDRIEDAIKNQNTKCEEYDYSNNTMPYDRQAVLNNNGEFVDTSNPYRVTKYIPVNKDKNYLITRTYTYNNNVCLYNKNKIKISCTLMTTNNTTITPTQDGYIRITYYTATGYTNTFSGQYCYNIIEKGQEDTTNSINDLNDNITDPSIDVSGFSGFTVTGSDGGISSIITAPLSAITGILNSTCTDLLIPIPFVSNKKITLPCLTPIYQQHFPQILSIWQVVVTGIIAYWICLNIFHMVHGFTDPNDDKIEVVDL